MTCQLPKYDLHCHSTASDGTLSPEDLLAKAKENGIEVLALTDHDTVAGTRSLKTDTDIRVIPGAEFTCLWNNRILHIVGLGLDLTSSELDQYLERISELRDRRAQKIANQLVSMGLPDVYEAACNLADGGAIGRPHFARALCDAGAVNNEQQAFKKYLGIGKKGDVKIEWPGLEETLKAIRSASGFSILAHPTKYKMTFTKLRTVIQSFVEYDGDGIEVSYPGVTPDHHFHLLRIANENQLKISAGSDFHSPGHSWTDLGKYPPLKSNENHILNFL